MNRDGVRFTKRGNVLIFAKGGHAVMGDPDERPPEIDPEEAKRGQEMDAITNREWSRLRYQSGHPLAGMFRADLTLERALASYDTMVEEQDRIWPPRFSRSDDTPTREIVIKIPRERFLFLLRAHGLNPSRPEDSEAIVRLAEDPTLVDPAVQPIHEFIPAAAGDPLAMTARERRVKAQRDEFIRQFHAGRSASERLLKSLPGQ